MMETLEHARSQIYAEVTRETRGVRLEYVKHFSEEAAAFSDAMSNAVIAWYKLQTDFRQDENRMRVLALAYTAVALHVNSMKLLLSGHTVASGNVFRQVVETIALTLLCSGKGMTYLERFAHDKYSTSDAVRDVQRNAMKLGVKKSALAALEKAQKFYNRYSHPSKLTIGVLESFAGEGTYIGTSFDPGKTAFYKSEVTERLKLAKLYPNFLCVVARNITAW